MKLKMLFIILALSALSLQGCDKEEDLHNVDPALQEALKLMYPDASYVEWEKERGYFKADFHDKDNYELTVWFTSNYLWYMTQTDIPFSVLPEAVKIAFNKSEYASWKVDDVDKVEKKDSEIVYVIEVEKGISEKIIRLNSEGLFV